MKNILAHPALLEEVAAASTLCAFDFDGTLAPIVRDPGRAQMRAKTRRLFLALAARYSCAIISGRSLDDLRARTGLQTVCFLVGNHGAEPFGIPRGAPRLVASWRSQLEARLGDEEGVFVEDKGASLAVHYRRAPRPARAHRAILRAVENLSRVRMIGGKAVVNLLPSGGMHKGAAVQRICAATACRTAMFVGDDQIDEDVFELERPALLGVRIGRVTASRARYYLRGQKEIDELLAALIELRSPRPLRKA